MSIIALVYLILQLATNVNVFLMFYKLYGFKQANVLDLIFDAIIITIDTVLNCYILYSFTQSIVKLICDQSNNFGQGLINDRQENKLLVTVTN